LRDLRLHLREPRLHARVRLLVAYLREAFGFRLRDLRPGTSLPTPCVCFGHFPNAIHNLNSRCRCFALGL
ncbi:unnamed protein product, partial [Pelagomonas calceolata]